MPDYTEAAIQNLDGADLNAAVCRLVLGDDLTANNDERLWRSVAAYFRSNLNGVYGHHIRQHVRKEELQMAYEEAAWKHRHGQPWQADLEAHVAAWRAKPWEQKRMDGDWCLRELMGPGKILCGWPVRYGAGGWDIRGCESDDPATAIKRAACIVALRRRGEA